jgi:hypothetical protein
MVQALIGSSRYKNMKFFSAFGRDENCIPENALPLAVHLPREQKISKLIIPFFKNLT